MNLVKARRIIVCLVISFLLVSVSTDYTSNDTSIQARSKLDIMENYLKNNFYFEHDRKLVQYEREPSSVFPYKAGKPQVKYMQEALNAVNFTRFLVGLPDDITVNEEYSLMAQHASVVNAANGELTHYPKRPADMPLDFYELGAKGARSSNIARGYSSIKNSIVFGYMDDSDTSNIDRVGHRRWIINPDMKQIGFGYAGRYSATYVFDHSRADKIDFEFISWPARGYMPTEYISMSTPWSVNLGYGYDIPEIGTVNVSLKNITTGQEWIFNKKSNNDAEQSSTKEFFNVDNGGYGMDKCIIFRPKIGEASYKDGHTFEVSIKGIYINGEERPIKYTVSLFSLEDSPSAWAFDEIRAAINAGLVPDSMQNKYTQSISRMDFSKLVINLLTVKTGKSINELLVENAKQVDETIFKDTKNIEVLAANALGIVNGRGKGIFDPDGKISRQEAAVMLTRTATILNIQGNTNNPSIKFDDSRDIAVWAKQSVDFVSSAEDKTNNLKVMGGTGNNRFSPNGSYTRQEAFITVKRLFNVSD